MKRKKRLSNFSLFILTYNKVRFRTIEFHTDEIFHTQKFHHVRECPTFIGTFDTYTDLVIFVSWDFHITYCLITYTNNIGHFSKNSTFRVKKFYIINIQCAQIYPDH